MEKIKDQQPVKEIGIRNLGDLQIALLEDDNKSIKAYIEHIDRATANDAMRKAGVHFGFPVVEVGGVVYTTSTHMATVFGYKTAQGLQHLLERRGVYGIKVGGFVHHVQMLQEVLGLDSQDYKSLLYDWPAFLIGGMNTQNEAAQKVQTYLLRMEQVGRVALAMGRSDILARPEVEKGRTLMSLYKLADSAWKGNPICKWILEFQEGVPVSKILREEGMEQREDVSEISTLLVRHFNALLDEYVTPFGLKKENNAITGTSKQLFQAFSEIGAKRNIPMPAPKIMSLGLMLSREAAAMELQGWKLIKDGKISGYTTYTFAKQGAKGGEV